MTSPDSDPAREKTSALGRLRGIAQIALLAVVVLTAASFVPRVAMWTELCTHFVNLYLLGAVVALVYFAVLRDRGWVLLAVVMLLANGGRVAVLYFPEGDDAVTGAVVPLRVLSMNVYSRNGRYNEVIGQIKSFDPDVLFVQEVTAEWSVRLRRGLPAYPYRVERTREDNFGIALLSKTPLESAEIRFFGGDYVPAVYALTRIGGVPVHLVNLHTLPPGDKGTFDIRNLQLQDTAKFAHALEGPVIVGGDFNSGPWSPWFKDFVSSSGLKDARRGHGIVPTWPAMLGPLSIPIDHFLVSPSIRVTGFRAGTATGSDHRPLVIDLEIPSGRATASRKTKPAG